MDPIVTTLFGTAARHLAGAFSGGDRYDLRLFPDAASLIGGMPAAFANWLMVDDGPQAADRARELVADLESRDLPGILLAAAGAGDDVAAVAESLDLARVGVGPWMVCRPERPTSGEHGYRVERVTTDAQLQDAYVLMADAFAPYDFTIDVWNHVFGTRVFDPSLANVFIAYRDDEPFSSVTTAGSGETIGIWNMATPVVRQRQGAGRAVLEQAMAWYQERGATTFYLMASPEGIRLYEQTGYRTVMETPIWLVGSGGQTAH
jgi:GNAT superfamily N-acetyltransferase